MLEIAPVRDERTTPMAVKYLYKNEPIEVCRYCYEYIFQVEGSQPSKIGIVINGGWHEAIPSLGWKGDERDSIAIAKGFLEKALAGGWAPTAENNRLEIPEEEMEYRVQNGPSPDRLVQPSTQRRSHAKKNHCYCLLWACFPWGMGFRPEEATRIRRYGLENLLSL
jgi:hypothetical protein